MCVPTLQDLDTIEAAVQTLNIAPRRSTFKTKFVEVAQNDNRALGFDWYLGNVLMGGGRMGVQGGTAPQFSGSPTTGQSVGRFPDRRPDRLRLPTNCSRQGLRTSSARQSANVPAIATLSGILTDPQFRVVLHALRAA